MINYELHMCEFFKRNGVRMFLLKLDQVLKTLIKNFKPF